MLEKERCDLSRYRLQRAKELISDAESLFDRESYKSSNNRAYWSIFAMQPAIPTQQLKSQISEHTCSQRYAGNGQIVNASNSKPYPRGGIKYTNVGYRTIVTVRRIF